MHRFCSAGLKISLLTLGLALVGAPTLAAQPGPAGLAPQLPEAAIAQRHLAIPDVGLLEMEDAATPGVALRVASPQPAGWNLADDGTWSVDDAGRSVWRLRVNAPGAVFTSFQLAQIDVPPGTELTLHSVDRQASFGPYDWLQLNRHGVFGTPAVPGEAAILEVALPARTLFLPSLVVESASYGYRDFRGFGQTPARAGHAGGGTIEKAMACEVDVACPDGNGWGNEIRAVALTYDGRYVCTGTLINNAKQDCRNLFLTAAHCVSRNRTANSLVLYWNFESSGCGTFDAQLGDTSVGTQLLATASASDFTLLELDQAPPASANVYYAGYDALPAPPQSAVAIHHPAGDEKKISFEFDVLGDGGGYSGGWGGDHWRILGWDIGTTEGGSSGSAIFDADHQIVGQLHGGTANCSGGWDEYGKLSSSWGYGLASFLDPDGTGALTLGGKDVSTCPNDPGGPSCKTQGDACGSNAECCSGRCHKKTAVCQ
jgi:hypothetical protein